MVHLGAVSLIELALDVEPLQNCYFGYYPIEISP